MKQHSIIVEKQFGAQAQNYLDSSVYASGADLIQLAQLSQNLPTAKTILDLGCGAGHVSFTLAEAFLEAQVTAYDLSEDMLDIVAKEAKNRTIPNIVSQQGRAETLPFSDNYFDLIVTRYSAHHWFNVPQALAQIKRVAKKGATLVVIDVIAPEVPLYDTILQTLEIIRDRSHIRDYRLTEWLGMLGQQGFSVEAFNRWKLYLEFNSWVTRINTPEARIDTLKTLMDELPEEACQYFQLTQQRAFSIDTAYILASI